jgi:hypothetical protein
MLSIPIHMPTLLLIGAVSLVSPDARAATPSTPASSARTIDVELIESGGKGGDQRATFSVPVDGEIDAWVRDGDDPRFCRVRVEVIRDSTAFVVELGCGRNVAAPTNLHVKARRALPMNKAVVIGRVSRPDGRTIEVRAKLH